MTDVAPRQWLAILGMGEDGVEGLSRAARAAIKQAVLVVGGARHLALAAELIRGDRLPWPSPLSDAFPTILALRGRNVAVLASGDPYCYGIAGALATLVPVAETVCIPTPSAFSLACARLGWAAQDVATLSACGRPLEAVLPLLQPGRRILLLSADARTPMALAELLRRYGFGRSVLHLLEAIGGKRERVRSLAARDPLPADIDPLNLLGVEVVESPDSRVIPGSSGLPNTFFEHDGQITKHEIRAATIAALAPRAGETLWDVGCGSGSVAIEWTLAHPANQAIGIEQRADRADRARRNALALGAQFVRIVTGTAPAAFAELPPPDAVFIGGGVHDPALLDTAWVALRSGGRIVANAVTLESQERLLATRRVHGGTLTRLSVERLDTLGPHHVFRPAIAVTQWAVTKP
jgi:precorrin-6B C5,15-methyltransferase / cobalt-precorrin-6B C5,C15-methyltransferase